MQQRITERLCELLSADADELDRLLRAAGIAADDVDCDLRRHARHLYEALLFNPYSLRTTTFHAFCQELLQRFPLEAGVPPGFELIETTGQPEAAA
jgi:ATP-dependent helicase/nuclease subunit A